MTFLRQLDQPTDAREDLLSELNRAFRKLYDAMRQEAQASDEWADTVNALELDLHELGLFQTRRLVDTPHPQLRWAGRRRVRTPKEVAEEAKQYLANLRECRSSERPDFKLQRAKDIAERMRAVIKNSSDHVVFP